MQPKAPATPRPSLLTTSPLETVQLDLVLLHQLLLQEGKQKLHMSYKVVRSSTACMVQPGAHNSSGCSSKAKVPHRGQKQA